MISRSHPCSGMPRGRKEGCGGLVNPRGTTAVVGRNDDGKGRSKYTGARSPAGGIEELPALLCVGRYVGGGGLVSFQHSV